MKNRHSVLLILGVWGLATVNKADACEVPAGQAGISLAYYEEPGRWPEQNSDQTGEKVNIQTDCSWKFGRSRGALVDVYMEYDNLAEDTWINFHELYLYQDFNRTPITVSLGFQQKALGFLEAEQPNSLFNPKSYLDGLFLPKSIGRFAASVKYLGENWVGHIDFMPFRQNENWAEDKGRYRRGGFVVEDSEYETDNSLQIRWDYFGEATELSVFYWDGVSPQAIVEIDQRGPLFAVDKHPRIQQLGFSSQTIKGSLALKTDAYVRRVNDESIVNFSLGISWYNYNVFSSKKDATVYLESYFLENLDNESAQLPSSFDNEIFLGTKIDFNDGKSSNINVGFLLDTQKKSSSFFTHFDTTLKPQWRLTAGVEVYNPDDDDQSLFGFTDDSRIFISNYWYF